ncbi:MAG: pentapeptide repeat-containing protein, partial [Acidobacteriota bacterium]
PGYRWIAVSAQGFAADTRVALESAGIICRTYADLLRELVPLEEYAAGVIADYQRWRDDRWRGEDWFVRPHFITDIGAKQLPALEFLSAWLANDRKNELVILGEPGTGKTRLSWFLAYQLACAFKDDPLRHPAPLLIPLGDVRKEISLEGLIIDHFSRRIQKTPDFRRFQHLVCQGKIIVIFDAFDEMADRVGYDEGFRNFQELSRLAELAGKVIITCRSNYFKDLREQRELIADAYTTALYEKLRESSGNEAVYVKHFDDAQILAYLKRARAASWQHDFDKIQQVYDLKGLAQLPLLLDMIVQTLDDFSADERINPAKLYERYTNQWVKREQSKKRLLLRPEDRLNLMRELAWRVWNNPDNPMRHRELAAFVKEMRDAGAFELRGKDVADIADEIHLATFLKRVGDSGFDFLHRSFMEFFLAGKLFSALSEQREGWSQWLDAPLLNRNVIHFLAMLDVQDQIVAPLQQIVTAEYRPRVSENALVTLYWSGRFRHGMDKRIETLGQFRRQMAGRIPPGIRMQGAKLAEVELQYADLSRADFAGADLSKAKFELAELVAANFADAVLTEASLERADLRQADFQRATLELTSFAGADLSGADFAEAVGVQADKFAGARLSGVRALSGVSGTLDLRQLEPVVQRGDGGGWIWRGIPVAFARTDKNDPASDVLAVGGADGVIRIYRAADGALLKTLSGHSDSVLSVAFSPDGERVVSGVQTTRCGCGQRRRS